MVVDPWGTVVTTAPDGVGIAHATVDPSRVAGRPPPDSVTGKPAP